MLQDFLLFTSETLGIEPVSAYIYIYVFSGKSFDIELKCLK